MKIWLAVFLGGGLGSALRFGITRLVLLAPASIFPWATLISNSVASGILAYVMLRIDGEAADHPLFRAFMSIGFCGGLSTFSTFSYENFLLLRGGYSIIALVNMVISLALCLFILQLFARSS